MSKKLSSFTKAQLVDLVRNQQVAIAELRGQLAQQSAPRKLGDNVLRAAAMKHHAVAKFDDDGSVVVFKSGEWIAA